jgi:hypothetical protein
VKEKLKVIWERTQLFLKESWESFREQSGFFQLKAGLVLGWVIISLLTAIIYIPRTIDFVMEIGSVPWGASERTWVDVTNQDGGDYNEVFVEVYGITKEFDGERSGVWTARLTRFPEGKTHRLWPDDLSDEKGRRPSTDYKVERVSLREGKDVFAIMKP